VSVILPGSGAGNPARYAIESHLPKYRPFLVALHQMLIDGFVMCGYLFHNACMTESFGVDLGPLPLLA
jgi:hypothetical protein